MQLQTALVRLTGVAAWRAQRQQPRWPLPQPRRPASTGRRRRHHLLPRLPCAAWPGTPRRRRVPLQMLLRRRLLRPPGREGRRRRPCWREAARRRRARHAKRQPPPAEPSLPAAQRAAGAASWAVRLRAARQWRPAGEAAAAGRRSAGWWTAPRRGPEPRPGAAAAAPGVAAGAAPGARPHLVVQGRGQRRPLAARLQQKQQLGQRREPRTPARAWRRACSRGRARSGAWLPAQPPGAAAAAAAVGQQRLHAMAPPPQRGRLGRHMRGGSLGEQPLQAREDGQGAGGGPGELQQGRRSCC